MAYFAPYIDADGLHLPIYEDVRDYIVNEARRIFGADIYLDNDSQDYQYIATLSLAIYESMLTAQYTYNQRAISTSSGVGLDTLVALNGITRNAATFSTVTVTLTGTAFTEVTNGQIADQNGTIWLLPETVTIGSGGTVSVTATALNAGAKDASAGQVNIILTPTVGWTSVTNATGATVGEPVETDPELKARQKVSVANPSQGLVTGLLGGVLAVPNVANAVVYENDSGSTAFTINGVENPAGYPDHSLTFVVDGGDQNDIASAIAIRKTPGAYLDGDVVVTVYDRYAVPKIIRFYRPTDIEVDVQLTIRSLTGYSSAVGDAIKAAIVEYVNSLTAGQSLILSEIWQASLNSETLAYPTFSLQTVTANRHGSGWTPAADDIIMEFNQRPRTETAYLTLNVV